MKNSSLLQFALLLMISFIFSCATAPTKKTADNAIDQGYGKIAERDRTTAISQTDLEDTPSGSTSWMEIFQKTSGVSVSGSGRNLSLQIRGRKSITHTQAPLYVVDGRAVGNGFHNVSYLDPGMVKRVSILKDGASSASYGSRGANGVVLITLKN